MAKGLSRFDNVISLAKRRGFVFPCGGTCGGTRSAWDYGPFGVELKENIEHAWWNAMARRRADVVGLDSSVILPREVWVASGHVKAFTDPLIECLNCHKRARQDQLIEELAEEKGVEESTLSNDDIAYPNCGVRSQWTEPRAFSGLLKTYLGPVDDEAGLHYLRPETTQGIFINYANVMNAACKKPPLDIGQVGKSFRNEIIPGNFISRTREFGQVELEFFCGPGTDGEWHQYWIDCRKTQYVNLGIDPENLRGYEHPQEKLSHYSKYTVGLGYRFGFQGSEWGELEGIANRTDYGLTVHSEASGAKLDYFDPNTKERWAPYVIEPPVGLIRSLMAFLIEAYHEDEVPNAKGGVNKRVVLELDPRLAPVRVAVLPLSRELELTDPAQELVDELRGIWNVDYNDAGAIDRRYRRQNEIGTLFRTTYGFDPIEDHAVTIRKRDTMEQVRIPLDKVKSYLIERLGC